MVVVFSSVGDRGAAPMILSIRRYCCCRLGWTTCPRRSELCGPGHDRRLGLLSDTPPFGRRYELTAGPNPGGPCWAQEAVRFGIYVMSAASSQLSTGPALANPARADELWIGAFVLGPSDDTGGQP